MVVPQSSVGAIAISKTVAGRLVLMRIMPDNYYLRIYCSQVKLSD
jgi:hypothetical protein